MTNEEREIVRTFEEHVPTIDIDGQPLETVALKVNGRLVWKDEYEAIKKKHDRY